MEQKARDYVGCAWSVKGRVTPWKRMDMDWFKDVKLVSTRHHVRRAVADRRDPSLACRRIQTSEGHHAKFGPPFTYRVRGDAIAVAAHDVAFVAVPKRRALIIVTTLPRNTFFGSFNDFIKNRCRREKKRKPKPAKGRNVNKPKTNYCAQ